MILSPLCLDEFCGSDALRVPESRDFFSAYSFKLINFIGPNFANSVRSHAILEAKGHILASSIMKPKYMLRAMHPVKPRSEMRANCNLKPINQVRAKLPVKSTWEQRIVWEANYETR